MSVIIDYGGRQPDAGRPFGGAVQAWDLDAETYHDYTSGADVSRPLNAEERTRFAEQIARRKLAATFQSVKTLIGSVDLITNQAEQDITHADVRQGQIEDWSTATTALAATIRGIATPTVAQIKEQLAVACERDVRIAAELDDFYQWRALVDQLLELLAQCVAGLARYVTQTTNGAP